MAEVCTRAMEADTLCQRTEDTADMEASRRKKCS